MRLMMNSFFLLKTLSVKGVWHFFLFTSLLFTLVVSRHNINYAKRLLGNTNKRLKNHTQLK
uniref:Uncharacterized protein n=1 Tax=Enterococcus faecium TaxID=1352 RepID=A0A0D5MCB5_ENTFC|nr:hypothetical protein pEfm12493_108 [Enterococcus faecium]